MRCRNCGEEVKVEGRKCPQCGILLTSANRLNPVTPKVKNSPVGKVVTILAVAGCIVAGLVCGYRNISAHNESEDKVALLADLVEKGSAADFRYLIQARELLDSMDLDVRDNGRLDQLLADFKEKQTDAFQSWCNAADAQYSVAESMPDALRLYCRADSISPADPELKNALRTISLKSGLKGTQIIFNDLKVDGSTATLYYKYYGAYETSLRLKIVWESGKTSYINLPLLLSDNQQTYSLPFNMSTAGEDAAIYEGNKLLYEFITNQ